MQLPPPRLIDASDRNTLDAALDAAPAGAAVFLLWPATGAPYLARTAALRRRLKRLLRPRSAPSRLLNLRDVARRIEFYPSGSRLESYLTAWQLGRLHLPDSYRKLLKLRLPPYVKLIRSHAFPRTQITTRLAGARASFFGPFRTRAAAERFENEFLDLFQIRRCQEDFVPSPDHPGCIYGEMNRCLRPCQDIVGVEEYATEVDRVSQFLATSGDSLLHSAAAARDRSSENLDFEEAARQHEIHRRIEQVLKLRDELVRDLDHLHGVAVTLSASPGAVDLRFVLAGAWLDSRRFPLGLVDGRPAPLDRRLRDVVGALEPPRISLAERQEHLAILARWFYSTWRDGEFLPFDTLDTLPYRKLINAIRRVNARR